MLSLVGSSKANSRPVQELLATEQNKQDSSHVEGSNLDEHWKSYNKFEHRQIRAARVNQKI